MDVRLPDGTVIKGVPDNISKAELVGKLKANGMDVSGLETPGQSQPDTKSQGRVWGDVPKEALSNVIPSAGRFFGGVASAIAHPIDTASGMLDIGAGALRNLAPEAIRNVIDKADTAQQQESAKRASETASNVGQMYMDRYGGIENLKNTLATDPVGAAADLSTVLAGGAGLARQGMRIPAIASKSEALANALMKGSQYTNPLNVVSPVVQGAANLAESGAQRLMRSALKPTIQQIKSGAAQTAVDTLLEKGINPTVGGVEKMKGMVSDLNQQIADKIAASSATVSKSDVLGALDETRQKFASQVSPTSDLAAIQNVASDFATHPNFPTPVQNIPVQAAQQMKQGTYGVLAKKYGQIGSAETEAQKALARGLKEGVAKAVPEVAPLNAQESRLIKTLDVAERRALMDMNKNPMGLALLANNPMSWAAFMADKSAAFKSMAARMLHQTSEMTNAIPTLTPQAKLAAALASRTQQEESAP